MRSEKFEKRKRLKKLAAFLDVARELNEKQLRTLFLHVDEDTLHLLFDAVHNCINTESNFLDTERQLELREPLGKYKSQLRYMTNSGRPIEKRREKLVQFGAGFPLLASLLVPVLAQLLG